MIDKTTLLAELEAQIDTAQCVLYEALKQIKDEKLYDEYNYPAGFWEYLDKRHGYTHAWFSQLQANYNALTKIEVTMPFKNEYAIRTLRESDKEVRQARYDRAVALAKNHGDEQVSAAHIKAVDDTLVSILTSGGYANDGDGGMMAADAQITEEYQERLLRRTAHMNDKREWFSFIYTGGEQFVIPEIPDGKTVKIKWYIVKESK